MSGPRFSLAGRLALRLAAALAAAGGGAAVAAAAALPPWAVGLSAVAVGLPLGLVLVARFLRPVREVLLGLREGVRSLEDGDFSLRLPGRGEDELGDLVRVYNRLSGTLSRERGDLRQRELLLHTALETSPAAVLLINAADRILFANRAARELFFAGRRLEGQGFAALLAGCPPALAEALAAGRDCLLSLAVDGADETFHVTRRHFELNARRHRLVMVRHLTPELRRQEAAIWKRVIRVIGHELNNSLAPIRSLVRSARLLRAADDLERLDEALASIDESAAHLHRFVAGYARFARLPDPRLEEVPLRPFLEHLAQLEPFRLEGDVPDTLVRVDPAQLQQVLVNLLKNAREAGSPPEEIALAIDRLGDGGLTVQVKDRGSGMDERTLAQALLPFYTSKPQGSGLGLALCREILESHGGSLDLALRRGGGLVVTCRLPGG